MPATLSALSTAADRANLPHSPRIARDGKVEASDLIWLETGVLAYVKYVSGVEEIVFRDHATERISTLDQAQALELIEG